ncbi:hypothetical protein EV383_3544 [Pseudonocardia sediminis]|uniref:Uncharacterized protein n=1 Tax=Pseudonocardia sediminis TaxID=1397368 RepID=A0A4Q7UX69_PSEST|nr:hypothetical protein [Pseudonocardia sediminis]RZT86647.1 hypothetical protein EV383_3544 [Pseudonocardia sediminis]
MSTETNTGWFAGDLTGEQRPLWWGAVCASGLVAVGSPTALQVLWLVVVAASAAAGPRASKALREAREQQQRRQAG